MLSKKKGLSATLPEELHAVAELRIDVAGGQARRHSKVLRQHDGVGGAAGVAGRYLDINEYIQTFI